MNWLRKWMYGRYGIDSLSIALIAGSLLMSLGTALINKPLLSLVAYITIAIAYFRILSKNFLRRQQENMRFLKFWMPIKNKLHQQLGRLKDIKTHKYYKCPACSQTLRVPKGRGRIRITCKKCKNEFSKKT